MVSLSEYAKIELTVFPQSNERPEGSEALAERLKRAPLPVSVAIRYACEIARDLRELHRNGDAHGSVNGCAIELRPSGAVLMPPAGGLLPKNAWRSDVHGFGEVLRSLFPDEPQPGTCDGRVWESVRRLTARCLAEPQESGFTMQKVLTEIRLLDVLERQWESTSLCRCGPQPQVEDVRHGPRLHGEASPYPPAPPPSAQSTAPSSALEFRRATQGSRVARLQCPRCDGAEVHRSTPRTGFEKLLERCGMPVLRCHECSLRYFRVGFLKIQKGTGR